MTIALSKLLASARTGPPSEDDGSLLLDVPEDWMQGRSVFGGLQVAFAVQAMRTLVPHAALRTLQATFIAPVAGTVRARARVLRTGKNVTHVEARIGDDSATQALVLGVFGTARSSTVARAPAPRANAAPPRSAGAVPLTDADAAAAFELPFGTTGGPSFIQHFHARWLRGQPPFTGSRDNEQILDLAIDDEGPASEATIIAIADFIPPIAFSWLTAPAAGSTLTWMLEMLTERVDQLPNARFRVEAEMVAARDGYTSQAIKLFAASGEPIALGHQSMMVFG